MTALTHSTVILQHDVEVCDELVAAIDAKRFRDGLTLQETYTGLTMNTYYALRKFDRSPLSWSSCLRVARWLENPYRQQIAACRQASKRGCRQCRRIARPELLKRMGADVLSQGRAALAEVAA